MPIVPPEPPKPGATPPPPAVAEPTAAPETVAPDTTPPADATTPPVASQAPLAQPDTPQTTVAEDQPSTTTTPAELPTPPFGRYYAVVIGIDDYSHLGQLSTAVTDAMAVTQLLEVQYGFNVTFLPDATRSHITQVLDNLRAILTPQDNLLIYYAGHGRLDEDERGYWLPQDALPNAPAAWLSIAEITEAVKAMAAKHVMVIADSCYSGTLARNGAEAKPATGDARKAYLARIGAQRSRTAMTSGGLKPILDSGGGGSIPSLPRHF